MSDDLRTAIEGVAAKHRAGAEHSGYYPHKESLFSLLDDIDTALEQYVEDAS